MIVNGKEFNISNLVKSVDVNSQSFEKVGNLMLTKKEIEILKRNFVDYEGVPSLKDLMIRIRAVLDDEFLDTDDADELEDVLSTIAERDYYENTRK